MPFTEGHALVIGVGNHKYLPQLDEDVTARDAEAVVDILKDPAYCGYPEAQVKLLQYAGTTKKGILDALGKLAGQPGDTVFIYYCGHGLHGADGAYYLVSHDAKIADGRVVAGTGVSEAELLEKIRAIPAQRVLMIFNACHSGAVNPSLDGGAPGVTTSNLPTEASNRLLATGKGRIIITACREDQKSYIGKGKLTYFTQALVDGLRGKGTLNTNNHGYVSAFGLYESVFENVTETIKDKLDETQEPELTVIKGVGPFAVALYRGAQTVGKFDDAEAAPQTLAVRQIPPEKITKIQNTWNTIRTTNQSGGINVSGGQVNVTGDLVGRDKITYGGGGSGSGDKGKTSPRAEDKDWGDDED